MASRVLSRIMLRSPGALVSSRAQNVRAIGGAAEALRDIPVRDIPVSRGEGRSDSVRGRRPGPNLDPLGVFDAFEPFGSSRSLRQMMDTMDRITDGGNALNRTIRTGVRAPWDVAEKDDGFYLRIDMPGLDKNDVKVYVEDEELVIEGQRKNDEDDIFPARKGNYYTRMILPKEAKKEDIKAELKNGVLTVVVAKRNKAETRKVVEVSVS